MSSIFTKRLTKELKDLNQKPPEGVEIEEAESFKKWKLRLTGAPGTIYEFRFTPQYPLEAPDVVFVRPHVPIYSNGHICLNILYKDWSPVQTVAHVCLSIISMMSSCKKKELPPDNDMYIQLAAKSPKKTPWAFQVRTCKRI
ncbi:ubiquitin-conjugating enzyme/RWD-like protein [Mycotypha africana]|uniref:ubiquitin-conjugating enzyme/RWD-like protein n=1 Tax=Mycotypha africana TaxID=64632 RepID=UPI0023018157|nr:ubiquitin-conjugating enzyme/RWD-like protein [Mycotypha africana]KAI8984264.1 ubiquitin-conjugating enzyme/RWD-like protein [Mycotypha africana]